IGPVRRIGAGYVRRLRARGVVLCVAFAGCSNSWLCAPAQRSSRNSKSSFCRTKRLPPKVVAAIMGHTKVDTTLNVYTHVLDGPARDAASGSDRNWPELARCPADDSANSLKRLAPQAGPEPATLRLTAKHGEAVAGHRNMMVGRQACDRSGDSVRQLRPILM